MKVGSKQWTQNIRKSLFGFLKLHFIQKIKLRRFFKATGKLRKIQNKQIKAFRDFHNEAVENEKKYFIRNYYK